MSMEIANTLANGLDSIGDAIDTHIADLANSMEQTADPNSDLGNGEGFKLGDPVRLTAQLNEYNQVAETGVSTYTKGENTIKQVVRMTNQA